MPSRRVKPPAKVEKKLFSREETAQVLGNIHTRTVDAMVKRGQLTGGEARTPQHDHRKERRRTDRR